MPTRQDAAEKAVDEIRLGYRKYAPWHSPKDPTLPALPRFERLLVDGIEFVCRDAAGPAHPLLLGTGHDEIVIRVGVEVCDVAVLGHVALRGGYPSSSICSVHHRDPEPSVAFGVEAAEYEFEFADGRVVQPLRHGLEILRSNEVCRWWTPQPRAPHTRPAVRCVIDKTYEVLRLDLCGNTRSRNPHASNASTGA